MNEVVYRSDRKITAGEFIDILKRSTLALRRPVDDVDRMQRILDNSQVIITAWSGELLVGVSRAITDFAYCCYLSDLAVDETYQHKGIGRELIKRTQDAAGPQSKLILLAAPAAINYYPKIGMEQFVHCFVSKRMN